MSERVNHPPHYQVVPNIECIEVVRHFNFNLGNAIKYIWRAGHKEGVSNVEDLKKAIWYLQDEVSRFEKPSEWIDAHAQNLVSKPTLPDPDWSEAPPWAQWWAVDYGGYNNGYWFEKEPHPMFAFRYWAIPRDCNYMPAGSVELGDVKWHESLKRRPE